MVSVVADFGAFACAPALAKVLATRHARDIRKNLLVMEVLPGRFCFFWGRALAACFPVRLSGQDSSHMLGPIAGSVKGIARAVGASCSLQAARYREAATP